MFVLNVDPCECVMCGHVNVPTAAEKGSSVELQPALGPETRGKRPDNYTEASSTSTAITYFMTHVLTGVGRSTRAVGASNVLSL